MQVTEAGNCLRLEVLRGSHMPRMDWTGAADPYIVLTAQSEAGLQMFRCGTAWDTLVRPLPPSRHAPVADPAAAACCGALTFAKAMANVAQLSAPLPGNAALPKMQSWPTVKRVTFMMMRRVALLPCRCHPHRRPTAAPPPLGCAQQ